MTTDQTQNSPPPPAPETLRTQHDFLRLWLGQSISTLGSSVSSVALPLVAVVTLNATAMQVGLLNFAQSLPVLPLSLFIGVLVDRVSRRRLLVLSDIGRGVVVGLIPLLALVDALSMEAMYACVFTLGVLTMVFDVAYMSYLPHLVPGSLLVTANSRMELTRNVIGLAGKGVAGVAVTVMRIPFVVAADAISYLCSAVSVALIRRPEAPRAPSPKPGPRQIRLEMREGLSALFANRYLRAQTVNAAVSNFLTQIVLTLFVLYATRDLHLSGGWIGVIFGAGSVGGVVGSLLVPRLVDRFGFGAAFFGFMVALRAALLCVAFVRGPELFVVAGLTVLWFIALLGLVGANICFGTLRQVAVPDTLRGRTNAALNMLIIGVTPLAALLAGFLGSRIGVHATLLTATLLMPVPLILVAFSPVRRMRDVSEAAPRSS
ncbi:MFS transporter [Streptomyces sp. NPDC050164]|uniref:MFS transporter n=1 Tax=Streptomyces sp. NPDC050164 TaxID=3365605 RepID=UPI0037986678